MKTLIIIFTLALVANMGFSQKNVLIHKNYGQDLKINAEGVDSITFTDHATPAALTFDTYTDTLFYKNIHCKTVWTASYKGDLNDFEGGFDNMDFEFKFDALNPANIKFDGKVELSRTQTFEPGRQGPQGSHYFRDYEGTVEQAMGDYTWASYGCLHSYMGVVWGGGYQDTTYHLDALGNPIDTIIETAYPRDSLDQSTNWAYLSAGLGDCVAYGDGYMCTSDFTFKDSIGSVQVFLEHLNSKVDSPTKTFHAFKAYFEFDSSSGAWYTSSSTNSLVRVKNNILVQEDTP